MIIDFHSHVLAGMDDGSRSTDVSVQLLEKMQSQGVGTVVFTPHFYANQNRVDKFLDKRSNSYDELLKSLDKTGREYPDIFLGAEVAYFDSMSRAQDIEKLLITESRLLLIEMPFESWKSSVLNEIEFLIEKRNITPIIAHVERFMDFKGNKPLIEQLIDYPLYLQTNCEVLTSFWEKGRILKMLRDNKIHLLGTDTHSLNRRPPNMDEGRSIIENKLGADILERIDKLGEALLY